MDSRVEARRYPFAALPTDEGTGWEIVWPDVPGVVGFAETPETIGAEAIDLMAEYIEEAMARGQAMPLPDPDWNPTEFTSAAFEHRTLTVQEVADELGVSRRRVHALAESRSLGKMVGKQRMFAPSEVDSMRERTPGRPLRTPAGSPT